MKKLVLIFSIGFLACSKNACFKNEAAYSNKLILLNETDTLRVFEKIHVELVPDSSNYLEIIAQETLLDQVVALQAKKTLTLRNENSCEWTRNYRDSILCRLHIQTLTFIDYQANGTLFSKDTLFSDVFGINCKEGGGHVDIILSSNNCHISLSSGVADVHVSGKTHNVYAYSNASTGVIHAENLSAKNAYCSNNSTGDFWVNSTDILEAEINLSGSIYYHGSPHLNRKGNGVGLLIQE